MCSYDEKQFVGTTYLDIIIILKKEICLFNLASSRKIGIKIWLGSMFFPSQQCTFKMSNCAKKICSAFGNNQN
jgi:hypothetical protein